MRKLAVLLVLGVLPLFAQPWLPPVPARYVTDAAGVIPDDREHALNERLAQYARETTSQLLVYVDRRVPSGTTIEELGAAAIRAWKVGQKQEDNGAILFLFVDDRQSRLEVGYGLEGTLTDARSKRILAAMRPLLRDGDYAAAVEQAANAILTTLDPRLAAVAPAAATPASETPAPAPDTPRKTGIAAVPIEPPPAGTDWLAAVLVLLFMGLVVALFVWIGRGAKSDDSDSWSSGDSTNSSSSSDSSYSGGGGSGGGGGASDRW